MTGTVAEFSLYLRVVDTTELWHKAAERAVLDGAFNSEEEYREAHDEDDVGTHLRMLLDPGSLPGCEILDSTAEAQLHE
jgi:hypothetical protein